MINASSYQPNSIYEAARRLLALYAERADSKDGTIAKETLLDDAVPENVRPGDPEAAFPFVAIASLTTAGLADLLKKNRIDFSGGWFNFGCLCTLLMVSAGSLEILAGNLKDPVMDA